ncbi:MAG: 2'-5' RNA ligase family protein [Bryobacteraceae bacterium]
MGQPSYNRKHMEIIDQHSRGELFALVSYVPEPLGSTLDGLKTPPSGEPASPAHITLLPPRPLRTAPQLAYERIREVLAGFPAFELELTEICQFPTTNVLYLAVGKGRDQIQELYRALNHGEFFHKEEFEFLPHLTLAYPADAAEAERMRIQLDKEWNQVRHLQPFIIDKAVFLSKAVDGDWNQRGEQSLSDLIP